MRTATNHQVGGESCILVLKARCCLTRVIDPSHLCHRQPPQRCSQVNHCNTPWVPSRHLSRHCDFWFLSFTYPQIHRYTYANQLRDTPLNGSPRQTLSWKTPCLTHLPLTTHPKQLNPLSLKLTIRPKYGRTPTPNWTQWLLNATIQSPTPHHIPKPTGGDQPKRARVRRGRTGRQPRARQNGKKRE